MPSGFTRKNIRLPRNAYLGHTICFATLCFDRHRALASKPRIASWLIDSLQAHATDQSFLIHAYCVMPDHVHLLTEGTLPTCDTLSFVSQFKQCTGYQFAKRTCLRLWQPKWYDHLVRPDESLEAVCWYIWMNPVRRRLCTLAADYPFLGSFSKCASYLSRSSPNVN